jgi:ribosomal protein S6--L-glutamate ligase
MLGWEEWLSLPDLGLPAIKAKVDTGAKTSALHAFVVEPFGSAARPMVRFGVHPIPGRDDVEVFCTAEVVDRRDVISSNGERESRFVVRTRASMGGRDWEIELTLTNRENMAYRMLLGRQAIREDMIVDPASSFRQPRLSYKAYASRPRAAEGRRTLRIALLTRRPESASNRRLARAIEDRGHTLVSVDRTRVSLFVDTAQPTIFVDGRSLVGIDAVIARGGRSISSFSAAIVRQLETLGAYAINPSSALTQAADALTLRQMLARAGVAVPEVAVSYSTAQEKGRGEGHVLAEGLGHSHHTGSLRFAVVGGRAVAAITREAPQAGGLETEAPQWQRYEARAGDPARHAAEKAARALQLGLASADIVMTRQGPIVVDLTPGISIALFERITNAAIAEAIVIEIEQATRTTGLRIESGA